MPSIRSSTDLQNSYNEISAFCHENQEPVFITKNGQRDLAVMSIETFETLNGRLELYNLLDEGRAAVLEGRKRSFADVVRDLRQDIASGSTFYDEITTSHVIASKAHRRVIMYL